MKIKAKRPKTLTQYIQLCERSDVVVLVGSSTAVAARVVISDAPDDQIAARQQRVLLIPADRAKLRLFSLSMFVLSVKVISFLFFVTVDKIL